MDELERRVFLKVAGAGLFAFTVVYSKRARLQAAALVPDPAAAAAEGPPVPTTPREQPG